MNQKCITIFHSRLQLLFLALLIISISSCSIFKKAPEVEQFDYFYKMFNSDSDFQLSRIDFPIEGYHEDLNGQKEWSTDNWIPHRAEISTVDKNIYETSVKRTESKYYEEIKARNGNLFFSRTFVKKKNKWYLTECINIEG